MTGPPVEAGATCQLQRPGLNVSTALTEFIQEVVERRNDAVGNGFIDEDPQPFRRLQFGGIGRQEDQMEPLRQQHLRTAVPARPIDHEYDVLVTSQSLGTGELGQHLAVDVGANAWHQEPVVLSRLRPHPGTHVAPLVAWPDGSGGFHIGQEPDPVTDRFETEAMFILSPHLDRRAGVGSADPVDRPAQPFGKAATSSGSAWMCWGRRHFKRAPKRTR